MRMLIFFNLKAKTVLVLMIFLIYCVKNELKLKCMSRGFLSIFPFSPFNFCLIKTGIHIRSQSKSFKQFDNENSCAR